MHIDQNAPAAPAVSAEPPVSVVRARREAGDVAVPDSTADQHARGRRARPSLPLHKPPKGNGRQQEVVREVREQLRQLCLTLFLSDETPIRSLGVTSALQGEGKSLLATTMAAILADDVSMPVTLLECNWDHPQMHERHGIAPVPGLAEWLRGEAGDADIRHQVRHNLTVIPAGNGGHDAMKLMRQLQPTGVSGLPVRRDEILIVDLPPIVSCAYGLLAASLVESLVLVVRAGKTPETAVAEASSQLAALPVAGVILNQVESRIPRWLQQLL